MLAVQVILVFVLALVTVIAEQEGCQRIDKKQLASFKQNNKDFAANLVKQITSPHDGNIVFSPWSISVALGMAMGGAKGKTLEQMKNVLAQNLKNEEIGPAYWSYVHDVSTKPKDVQYSIYTVNSIFMQKGFNLVEQFRNQHIQQCLMGEIFEVDFKKEPENARMEVNGHVDEETHDKIKHLLPKNSVSSMTRLILVNTLYLKAAWLKPFSKENTKQLNFISKGIKQLRDFMGQDGNFNYLETEQIQMLQMKYVGSKYVGETMSLFIVLHKEKAKEKRNAFSHTELKQKMKETKEIFVEVKIPIFKIKFQLQPKEILKNMGIRDLFDEKADLTGISQPTLYVDGIYHEAVFNINENGTEALAATAVVADLRTSLETPKPKVKFIADHEFMFTLYHHVSESILFQGSVVDLY